MKLITVEIFHLYESFNGDIERILQESNEQQTTIPTESLHSIKSSLQDIQLINSRHCSDIYTARVLTTWREICDNETFIAFTNKIPFYSGFQTVAEILCQISRKINPSTDTVWAGFDSPAAFLAELKQDIHNIRNCSFTTLDKILIEFGPTCSYQELSLANGWAEEYLTLSEQFDSTYCRLVASKECAKKMAKLKPWWRFW